MPEDLYSEQKRQNETYPVFKFNQVWSSGPQPRLVTNPIGLSRPSRHREHRPLHREGPQVQGPII